MDDGTRIAPEVEAFLRAARAGDVERCFALLQATPTLINSVEAGGFAALHFAAFAGNLPLIEMLKSFKPELDIKNYDGNTPLMLAAKMARNDAIRLLVEMGADINFSSGTGVTAAHHACGMGHLHTVRHLRSLGAQITWPEPRETGTLLHWSVHHGELDDIGALLYEFKLPIDAVDLHGGTALFTAIHAQKPDAMLFLLEHGANPNVAVQGATPLHLAIEVGTLADVKNLLAFGARPDTEDHDGVTPLKHAITSGKTESAKELGKPRPTDEKRLEDAARFKNHGNKVFADGENIKAAKFYTLAISLDPKNHVYFSNRSACHFNTSQFRAALYDAERCIALNPAWPRGYMRKAASLRSLMLFDEAMVACDAGLKLEAGNKDLLAIRAELTAAAASVAGAAAAAAA